MPRLARLLGDIIVDITFTAVIGIFVSLTWWRVQLIGKRRFEVAEEALTTFAKAHDAMIYVRSSGGYASEASTRPRAEGESPEEARVRDLYFIPIKRLRDVSADLAAVITVQGRCRYHLGRETAELMGVLLGARNEVLAAVGTLQQIDLAHVGRGATQITPPGRWRLTNIMWASSLPDDVLSPKLDAAKARLEEICEPHLGYGSAFWPLNNWLRDGLPAIQAWAARAGWRWK
ncbi:MAG TPA: hypothetical protein VGO34_11270 [Alphaproteobacteria bacterium]|jgi:hypothetical protein